MSPFTVLLYLLRQAQTILHIRLMIGYKRGSLIMPLSQD